MSLTPTRIRAARPTGERQYIRDGNYPLWLVVQPSGLKSFQWRGSIGGKMVRKTLGSIDEVKLAKARDEALRLKALSGQGKRVRSEKSLGEVRAVKPSDAMTVAKGWALYMEREGNLRKSADEKWRTFHRDIEPVIGSRLLASISREDCEEIIATKHAKARIASHRLLSVLNRFFRWCVREGHRDTKLDANPCENVVKMSAESKPRQRTLDEAEIKLFLQALPEAGIFADAYRALLYSGARKSEIMDAKRTQLEGDLLTLLDTKNGTSTIVWFHPTIMASLERDDRADDDESAESADAQLFSGSDNSADKALDRVRIKMAELGKLKPNHFLNGHRFTLHDLRRTMSNWMGDALDENDEPLIDPHTIERCLNHIEKGVRAKHYSKNLYLAKKKRAWKVWADYLESLSADLEEKCL